MPKVMIAVDERFPEYVMSDELENPLPVELTAAELADFIRVAGEYEAWQDRLRALYDAAWMK